LAEALGRAATVARRIAASGVAPGERVAMVDSSSTGYIVSWLACLLSGNPVALINPTYPDELLDQMLDIFEPSLVWRAADMAAHRHAEPSSHDGLPGLVSGPLDVISYMHTSGTTGVPKFCAQTNDYFVNLARDMGAALELRAGDRVLAPLPLFHINPMGYGLVTGVLAGCDVLSLEKFSASGFWPTVKSNGITVLVLHAPPVEILKRATTAEDAAGHTLRTMFYANAEFMETFGVGRAVSGYGSTEAGGISHIRQWSSPAGMPDNASRYGGPARPGIEWRLDEAGGIYVRELAPGTLFAGYARAAGLDPARDDEGWFDTGDLGTVDENGDLVFLERGAESIRVKGEFVPIPFVEERIATVSALTDFAIWKRKGELVDDDVVLYVVSDSVPAADIKAAVADAPAFMHPVAVARVTAIPRDAAAGKVQRRLLTDQEVLEWVTL
jgi:acyl-CoA synthetase (AMP-forming)/AMP-acid ligase II